MSGRKTGPEGSSSEHQHKNKRQRRHRSAADLKTTPTTDTMDLEQPSSYLPEDHLIGRRGMIDRTQYIRLLQQSLSQLGHSSIAEQLEKASGVPCQSPATSNLQTCVLQGDWEGALEYLTALDMAPTSLPYAKFYLLEQKFIEILDSGDGVAAIKCLRNELTPLGVNISQLHELSHKLIPNIAANGSASSGRKISTNASEESFSKDRFKNVEAARRRALQALQKYVPAGTLLPEGRLEELVEQALTSQIERCRLHNTSHPRLSLLRDYSAGVEQLPLHCAQILKGHTSEVWHLQFSHDGKMLATSGRDMKVIIWKIEFEEDSHAQIGSSQAPKGLHPHLKLHRILSGHSAPVQFLTWSPNDQILASCGQDCQVRLWHPRAQAGSPACFRVLQHHREPVLSACWLPDNQTLVTAGQDRLVAIVGIDGEVHQNWRAHRMQDVAVTRGGRYILVSSSNSYVL